MVRDAVAGLRHALSAAGIDDDTAGSVELVAAEALNNIVEHAYPDAQAGQIEIGAYIDPSMLYLTIIDAGGPMPDTRPPPRAEAQQPDSLCELPEGGFGWSIIRQLCEEVQYRRHGQQNHLLIRFAQR